MQTRKCLICERRPAREKGYCGNCNAQLEAARRRKQKPRPFRYVTYQGTVVAFHKNGGGTLKPELSGRSPDKLPARTTINLDKYCPGFTRQQVKKLKACVRELAK